MVGKKKSDKKIDVNAHIGQKLRMRRVMLGLSQEAVGQGIGVAAQQVQKYEKGVNAMNAERLLDFARFFKIPVATFFEGLDSKALQPAPFQRLKGASDREAIEVLKSFKAIKDYGLRKRIADLLRSMALKDI